jgi:hypothetical protein
MMRIIELSATHCCPAQAMLAKVFPMELKHQIIAKAETWSAREDDLVR